MPVSVEKVSSVERRLTIVVPVEQVEEEYAKQIEKFAKQANIKGFRPGKAPRNYIEQRYGNDVRKDALNDIIQKALYNAIAEQNLKPVSTPRVEPKMVIANQPLEFVASFEVLPEIENVEFSIDQVEKLNVEISPTDIDTVLEQLKKQYTKWNVVERPAQDHDRVVISYHAIFEGKSDIENKIENFPLELGSNMMLPGFEQGLVGVSAGDARTLNLAFPEDFAIKERAGKPVEFVVEVKQVFQAEAPTIDEDFIKRLGVQSGKEEDLRTQVKQSLDLERDRLVKEKLKEQIFKALLEKNPIEVPNSMVEREAKSIHDEVYQHQHHDHHSHSADELAAFNDVAKKRVALGLLIAEYAKQKNIKADQERVKKRIAEIASVYESPTEVMEWLSSDDRRSGIEAQVLEDMVMESLMNGIATVEKTISYADLKGMRS